MKQAWICANWSVDVIHVAEHAGCFLTYLLNYLLTYILTYLHTYLHACMFTCLLTYLHNFSMEQFPSWEANRFGAGQEIPRILWNPEGSLPHSQVSAAFPCPDPARSSLCPTHRTSWRSILLLFSHLHLGHPSGHFPSGYHTKTLYIPLLSPVRATFPAYLILDYSPEQ